MSATTRSEQPYRGVDGLVRWRIPHPRFGGLDPRLAAQDHPPNTRYQRKAVIKAVSRSPTVAVS